MRVTMRFFALGAMISHIFACHVAENARPLDLPRDEWSLSGRVGTAGFRQGEILALGIDGTRYSSKIQNDNSFFIQLPGNTTYAIHFTSPPTKDAGNIRAKSPILTFDAGMDLGKSDTLRLPKPTLYPVIDLGIVDIKNTEALSTRNPSRQLDADTDGLQDFLDTDDQNDGLGDNDQKYKRELVGICHREKGKAAKFMLVPLSSLLSHLQHKDSVGHCQERD